MNKIKHKINQIAFATGLALACSTLNLAFVNNAYAQENWQPVSADSLVELPANLIEKRIQQDFRMSPMATELLAIEQDIGAKSQQIKALKTLLGDASSGNMIDEKVDLIQLKSAFLDLMQTGQQLRQTQLGNKIDVYQQVLAKLYSQSNEQANTTAYQLKLSQQAAKARMEKVMRQVDETLLQDGYSEQSPYAKEFAVNLEKIDQLKSAINAHKANLAAKVDGIEVSTQEYMRQLLMQSSTEQSLLDQEALMLSYMAKIVALDAQSLEFSISEAQEVNAMNAGPLTTPATSVSLFL
ncbi:MAG: hypothetical protein ACJAVV_001190 [Alphaproteobacteria bacterium]|jgi:hypothetical protein